MESSPPEVLLCISELAEGLRVVPAETDRGMATAVIVYATVARGSPIRGVRLGVGVQREAQRNQGEEERRGMAGELSIVKHEYLLVG
ncbi:MAG: hypothetical protein IPF95_03460 [Flavobacteriales bacterium]|nr:hypothetical protein [Flavobacteriales bacterium]MBK7298213.1 hypothetical protein [Flavobacteriales bacterium]MBK9534155.1 hypothetical protein [Flavobacteriales bacterium]MBP9140018.1 hypothetical protein [Flavobacteriales bacterium]HQX31123.1 hypothetical protein [Flavobacteriales bacterium]